METKSEVARLTVSGLMLQKFSYLHQNTRMRNRNRLRVEQVVKERRRSGVAQIYEVRIWNSWEKIEILFHREAHAGVVTIGVGDSIMRQRNVDV